MKRAMRKAERVQRKNDEKLFVEARRDILRQRYSSVRLVYVHSRRGNVKWLCDGKSVYTKINIEPRELPDGAFNAELERDFEEFGGD